MSGVHKKRYKKLYTELMFLNSEMDYIKEVLRDSHRDFESFYREYCSENEIDIPELEKNNRAKVDNLFKKENPYDEEGIVKTKRVEFKDETNKKHFLKIYRQIAKTIHPDKFASQDMTPEIEEKISLFKRATTAMEEKNWGILLDISEKLGILIEDYEEINKILKKEIELMKGEIKKEKSKFSWLLHECEENTTCRENVVKKFLHQVFNLKI